MDHRVEKIIADMQAHLHRRLSLSNLARTVNLSPAHLRQIFTAETDMSPLQYLRELRLQRAKRLLETTFLSVKEIMVQVGASDKSHFGRNFKKAFGLTPVQYRGRYRSAPQMRDQRLKRNQRIG